MSNEDIPMVYDVTTFSPDADPGNAAWAKRNWNLPPYKSDEFMAVLNSWGMDIDQFRESPTYRFAVQKGLIKGDRWVAP